MPASFWLRAAGLSLALSIVVAAALFMPLSPPGDPYRVAMRLAAGFLLIAGAASLSWAMEDTFLRAGGNAAFRALYCTTLALSGVGISGAASAFSPMNLPLSAALAALLFSGAGIMLLRLRKGGA